MSDATRLLVVDDNDLSRELAHDILDNAGYDVAAAATVDEALSLLDRRAPAVILLDWHLKGATGGQVIAAVRASPAHRTTAVIVVTADIRSELRDAVIASGADGLLTKPYRAGALLEAVADALRTHERGGM